MSANLDTARRIPQEVMNQGNVQVIDEVSVDNVIDHDPPPPGFPPGNEGFKAFVTAFRQAFPDLHYDIDQEIEAGDLITQVVTGSGTMQGEFAGMPATGKRATWHEIHVSRIENGKIAEHWGVVDQLKMMQDLGVIPTPEGAPAG
ncbi:MAG TPA: ester cyclase [Candidatus Dormibacteraeota bacterium]|jgi:predicted ester cyclase|nr:ester cyclase [Candidatus Dormibacteraeota bacterium]